MKKSKIFTMLFIGTAAGCLLWLSLVKDIHFFRRELSQESRAAIAVGAAPLPAEKIKILIRSQPRSCIQIERARLDAGEFEAYVRADCTPGYGYWELRWAMKSPDGTIIGAGRWNTATLPQLQAGDKAEVIPGRYNKIEVDPRASVLEIWTGDIR